MLESSEYMDWRDVANLVHCGRNKALLLMNLIDSVYVGNKRLVKKDDLFRLLEENSEIHVDWSAYHPTLGGNNNVG